MTETSNRNPQQIEDISPLLDLAPAKDLSPDENTIMWAHQIFNEYSGLPQVNSRQRQHAGRFIKGIASQLLDDPKKIGIAGSVWKSLEPEIVEGKPNFYSVVKNEASRLAKDNWKDITSEQLVGTLRVLAHSELASDIAHDILQSYFRGPKDVKEIVDAFYKFTYGTLDLLDDPKSLEQAVRIGNYTSDIFPQNSRNAQNLTLSLMIVDDDKTLAKALTIDYIMFQLCALTAVNVDEVRTIVQNFFNNDSFKQKKEDYFARAVKKLGSEIVIAKANMLDNYFNRKAGSVNSIDKLRELEQTWPSNLVTDDPLWDKFNYYAKDRSARLRYGDEVKRAVGEEGRNYSFFNILQPDGYILSVFHPVAFGEKRSDLVRLITQKYPMSESSRKALEAYDTFAKRSRATPRTPLQSVTLDGKTVIFTYEKASNIEAWRHPILSLEAIGFPLPIGKEGTTASELNEHLAKDIKNSQIRFLNKRGVRVPFQTDKLKDLGYNYVDFYKDDGKTRVEINVNGLIYKLKFDANFNLDFEGKIFDSPLLGDFLKYTFLSLLRPILCDERLKGEKDEEITQEEREVVTRMGHLRWLPHGQKYTRQAVENYFNLEGGDLAVKDLERRLDAERKLSPHANHSTTYVKPVTEPEENLPPLVLNLGTDVLRFAK